MKLAWVYVSGFAGALLGAFLALLFIFQSNLFNAATRNLDPWAFPVAVAGLAGVVCGTAGLVLEDRRFAVTGLLFAIAGVVYVGIGVFFITLAW